MNEIETECFLKQQIQYFFDCGPASRWRVRRTESDYSIVLGFRNSKCNGNVELQITLTYDNNLVWITSYNNLDSGKTKISLITFNITESEEEYFQLSTIKDMHFTWEFYQYLEYMLRKE